MSLPPLICLMGPTAAGKTGLAISLCERFPLDIISVDSALVYRGMNIGTAKPDAQTLARAPHRLINLRDPGDAYSAADFRADALREIEQIVSAGRIPMLVGGTMLYFRALLEGLSDLPEADPAIRAGLEARGQAEGWDTLHAELAVKDPVAAEKIDPNDPQRIQRALEVHQLTGTPLSELQKSQRPDPLPYRTLKLVICPPDRAVLHQRIAQRFDLMMEQGFPEEARALRARPDFDPQRPAMRAVGYRQAWPWLDGRYGQAEMREKALAATRQLAKRQLTWLRREPGTLWYDPDADKALDELVDVIEDFLESSHDHSNYQA